MKATTEKLCCNDVFSQEFDRSPTIISCFSRTARRHIERIDCRVPAAYRAQLHWTLLYGPQQPGLNWAAYAVWGRACIAFRFPIWTISRTECAPAQVLLGESWPTDHRQVYCSVAWQTEGCGSTSSEWWTHWTVVLTIWFICCRALLRIARAWHLALKPWFTCELETSVSLRLACVRLAIMYWALLWYCDKK